MAHFQSRLRLVEVKVLLSEPTETLMYCNIYDVVNLLAYLEKRLNC